jgi:hypothetical protein
MAWSEIGGTYGTIFLNKGYTMIYGAVTVKRIFGFQQSTLVIRDADVDVLTRDNATLNNLGQ